MYKKIVAILVILVLELGYAGLSLANDGAFADFNAHYPGKSYGCDLCHTSPPDTNSYGTALVNQGATGDNITDAMLIAVENVDSDGDGFNNIAEITAGTLPGNAASQPPPPGVIIDILAPNKGDIIPSGVPFTILYDAPPKVTSVIVRYSFDGGLTWLPALGTPGAGSFDWDVPTPKKNLNAVRLKVIGLNASGRRIGRGNSAVFGIETVDIDSPTNGDTLTGGGSHVIQWITNGTKAAVDSIELRYSKNNGLTWERIVKTAKGTGNPGFYTWDNTSENPIPAVPAPKTKSRIMLILRDNAGKTVGVDVSNKFTIQ